MNAFGYIISRVLWQFGLKRQKHRWKVANQELQYLKQAEDLLGKIAWEDIQNVEELTGEFWQLKDIEKQQADLEDRIELLEDEADDLEEEYLDITEDIEVEIEEIEERRAEVAEEVDELLLEVEELREEAAQIRHRFDGLKVKYRVLRNENPEASSLKEIQDELRVLQQDFNLRKQLTIEKNKIIDEVEADLAKIDAEITAKQDHMAKKTSGVSLRIGENSKTLADCIARIGALDRQKRELQSRVGLYLSANPNGSSALKAATRKHLDLVNKINYFRKSIQYNQRLAKGG